MKNYLRVRELAHRNAIRRSQRVSDSELIGNALPRCFEEGEYPDGFLHAQYMEEAMARLAEKQSQ